MNAGESVIIWEETALRSSISGNIKECNGNVLKCPNKKNVIFGTLAGKAFWIMLLALECLPYAPHLGHEFLPGRVTAVFGIHHS
ncbi:MAG: hypothetical protein KTR14_09865 [Vampirovibrio sp.]|nr:hypothetical protein [Vampirovibrio sp.]